MSAIEGFKNTLRRGRWIIRSASGKDVFHRRQVRRPVTRMGGRPETGFGAWVIDTQELSANSIIYSVGVGDDISFDLSLIERIGATVHGFDPTPESHRWLEQQNPPPSFILHKYGLAGKDGTAAFFANIHPDWVAHSFYQSDQTIEQAIQVEVRRLGTLMEMLDHDHIDLLKIDIEGAEYEVIQDITEHPLDIRQLLVEFHHRMSRFSPNDTREAVRRLNEGGYRIFHISPNGEEYSFIRNRKF